MKSIFSHLSKRPFSFQVIFWMALGPFFLVTTLALLLTRFCESGALFGFSALLGLVLVWAFRFKGFVISIALVCASLLVTMPHDYVGLLCFLSPIICALFLTALSVQECLALMAKSEKHIRKLGSIRQELEQNLRKDTSVKTKLIDENRLLKEQMAESKQWATSLKRLMAVGQQEKQHYLTKRQNLSAEVDKYKQRIQGLEKQLSQKEHKIEIKSNTKPVNDQKLLSFLNDLRVRHYQLELLSSQYRDQLKILKPKLQLLANLKSENLHLKHDRDLEIQKATAELKKTHELEIQELKKQSVESIQKQHQEEIETLKKTYEEKLAQLPKSVTSTADKKFNSMYKQLKSQFEDKDRILHSVRKELYQAQGELYGMKQALVELEHEPSEELKVLYRYAQSLKEELVHLEEENTYLLSFIKDHEKAEVS